MTPARILIAGIGNIFMGDDAFGVEVAQRLARLSWPDGVLVKDFGIRSLDLTYALTAGHETVILIDATPRGGAPGTVYVIEPDIEAATSPANGAMEGFVLDAHTMNPLAVLRAAKAFSGALPKCLLVGCEPADLGDPNIGLMGLSAPVAAAIERAVDVVESLVSKILASAPVGLAAAIGAQAEAPAEVRAAGDLVSSAAPGPPR